MAGIKILLLLLVCGACPLSSATTVELIRDEEVVLDLLRHGNLNLSKDVARLMSHKTSERRVRRVGLQKDGYLIRAAFRDKAVKINEPGGSVHRYHDTYYNELAAYLVSRYLGLNIIPATVLRSIPISSSGLRQSTRLRQGTLQLWVENSMVAFDLSAKKIPYPGNPAFRNLQLKEILALDCIIGNVDRHAGNILIDLNERFEAAVGSAETREPYLGKIWAIDHTRAFHASPRLGHKYCRLSKLTVNAVSLTFIQGIRSWNSDDMAAMLRSGGFSEMQLEHLNLKALERRVQLLKEHFDSEQQKSGLPDEDFYSSGIWHRVW